MLKNNQWKQKWQKSWEGKAKSSQLEASEPLIVTKPEEHLFKKDSEQLLKMEEDFEKESSSSISDGEGVWMDLSDKTSSVANISMNLENSEKKLV